MGWYLAGPISEVLISLFLPVLQVSALKNKLKKQSTATGDGVARAFLRAQAALFGSYRDALRYKPVSLLFAFAS